MYDPLIDKAIPNHFTKPDGYWSKNITPNLYPNLNSDIECEVAIIGGGFTGLSAAYHLKTMYDVDCVVLEANQPGWGASGRNGGFVLPGSGRLSLNKTLAKFGDKTAVAMFKEFETSVKTVNQFIEQGIECQKVTGGYLKLAHNEKALHSLLMQPNISQNINPFIELSKQEITENYLRDVKQYGGIYYKDAFSINPYLLSQGLARLTQKNKVKLYGNSPIIDSTRVKSGHVLTSLHHKIHAKSVVIATNAYTSRRLFPIIQDRFFPVVSSIIVTEPLNQAQLTSLGMKSGLMVMDTRALKYYYRLLPNNRLLFGGRGAIAGKNANHEKYAHHLLKALKSTFSCLNDVKISEFHSGWVAISLDDYPRIFHDTSSNTLYSAGYCGAGLAFSIQAGLRLAQLYREPDVLPDLPFYQSPLKRFPMANFRRIALSAFYAYEAIKHKFNAR